jgi:Peptidase family M23
MPLQPVLEPQPLLLVPPLLPPLALRTENGFFGARRGDVASFGDCPPCARFEEPPSPPPAGEEPDDQAPPVRYARSEVHEALDLEGEAGDCVFAAYLGKVVEVDTSGDGTRGNVTIDHHPLGMGLVSRYLHLDGATLCVAPGDAVTKGQVIGRIGSGPADPHLHFELRIVLDRSDQRFWTDRNAVAVDPTRLLYRFEADALPVLQAAAATVTSIGVQTVARVPLFRAGTDASDIPFSIPLCEPVTEHERAMAAVFTKALELGRQVAVEYRESRFFGDHRVPVSVHLV